jgi:hypothetical protein
MIKSAAFIKDKSVASWKELRLQKKNLKIRQAKERKQNRRCFPSPIDAPIIEVQNVPQDDALPTRAELEAKATELGIKFDDRTKDKKMVQLIQDQLPAPTGE